MNFSKQLKAYRESSGLSQEALAKKIYVSRQTISKWENDRTYPDIHNLITLSALFNITLDELVKGDLELMKQHPDISRVKKLAGIEIFFTFAMALSCWPAVSHFSWWGFAIPLILFLPALICSILVSKIKKNNQLQTFQEILTFLREV